jgi:hypothetical protein
VVGTLHCLTGCAIGEVLGMVIGTNALRLRRAKISLAAPACHITEGTMQVRF